MSKLEDQARSILKRLSNLALKLNVSFLNISTEFLLERLVVRLLQNDELSNQLVFKGGYVALRVYNSPRFTVDLDALLKRGNMEAMIKRAITSIEADLNDAAWFRFEKVIDLKTQGEYGGKRLVFRSGIGPVLKDIRRAQLIQLDIGIGDPITPGPVKNELTELLGEGKLSWQVYPIETSAAEKCHALITRGSENSRAKDVFDLSLFLDKVDPALFKKALEKTFEYRGDTLPSHIPGLLRKIDVGLLKRGWKSAVGEIESAKTFEATFEVVIEQLTKLL